MQGVSRLQVRDTFSNLCLSLSAFGSYIYKVWDQSAVLDRLRL
jgi:hypothetical protein